MSGPGGGGGGAFATTTTARGGGAGFDGQIILTWTDPTPETSPALEASGFTITGPASGDTINSVTVAVTEHQSDAAQAAATFELWDGSSSKIGATQTGTASTSGANVSTATFTGVVTYAQLATLRVRVFGNALSGTSWVESVDSVSLVVNYTASTLASGTASAAVAATATATAVQAATAAAAGTGSATATATASQLGAASPAAAAAATALAVQAATAAASAAGSVTAAGTVTGAGLVQSKQGHSTTSPLAITLDAPTTAGNGLIVVAGHTGSSNNGTVSGITLGGAAGNFASAATSGSASANAAVMDCWLDLNCAGGQTAISIAFTGASGTTDFYAAVYERADLPAVSASDKSSGNPVDCRPRPGRRPRPPPRRRRPRSGPAGCCWSAGPR